MDEHGLFQIFCCWTRMKCLASHEFALPCSPRVATLPCMNVSRAVQIVFVFTLLSHVCAAAADDSTTAAWLAEHYTKYEHRIPMRDGVRLFTRVYVPKDDSQ